MEGGSLFNPGFLGANFLWWVGQIADDSTWRDNISTGIHESKYGIPGWGRRYKVRIIGLHDQGENEIPSDQLPWAQVMYPVTGGGGQTNASQTANLRQGMFVFGFFLDGQDQQVPVIMGVLGNNSQTSLATNWQQVNQVTNESPGSLAISGNAEGAEPKSRETREKVPDYGKEVEKPKDAEQSQECASAPAGVKVDEFGLRSDLPLSKAQFADSQSARTQADTQGLTGADRDRFIRRSVAEGIKQRCVAANSPGSPAKPGATIEQVDSVHKLNAASVIRQEKLGECIPLMKPDDKIGSALKAIQTVLDNLTQKITKYLNAATSYIDAVTSKITEIQSLIANAACEIAKYMKIVFDKIMEYVLKQLNKNLTKAVSAIPSTFRYLFGDIKETITELILCLYNKITEGLCGLIQGLLDDIFKPQELEERRNRESQNPNPDKPITYPDVPICVSEKLTGDIISFNRELITNANNTLLDNVNTFLDDIKGQLTDIGGGIEDISSLIENIGGITGSMTSALSFENLSLNVFGCELKPNPAVSDCYTFGSGGEGKPDSQLPSGKGVEDATNEQSTARPITEIPFAEPTRATPDVDLTTVRIVDRSGNTVGYLPPPSAQGATLTTPGGNTLPIR